MRLHPFFHILLHFLLSFVDIPFVHAHSFRQISPGPGGIVRRVSGDDYAPSSNGSMLYRTCDHDGYFNPDHWDESGAAEAYLKWSMLVDKTSEAWQKRQSEPSFFLHDVLNWSDFDCGITYRGCIGMPTCDEILTRTQNKTTARQIYFALLSMHNLNLVSGVVNEQSVPAQANVASMAANMANTFFWKHSDEGERQCKLAINVLKGLLAALMTATFMLAPYVAVGVLTAEASTAASATALASEEAAAKSALAAERAVVKEVAAVQKSVLATKAKSIATSNLQSVERQLSAAAMDGPSTVQASLAEERAMLENELTLTRTHSTVMLKEKERRVQAANDARTQAVVDRIAATQAAKDMERMKAQKYETKPTAWTFPHIVREGKKLVTKYSIGRWAAAPFAFMGLPMVIAGNDVEAKFCAKYPNPPKEAQRKHELQLDTDIRKASVDFRQRVQSDLALINGGVGFGENGTFPPFGNTVLSDQIFTGYYVKLNPTDHIRFVEQPSQIEADITNHFKNALISAMLKEEICFLRCTRKDESFQLESMSASQFEPVPGTLCQTQCWRNWKKGKNVELYGIYDLLKPGNDWNVDLRSFVSGSFKHWQDHRFDQNYENLFPTVEEILTVQATSSSGSFLPVCYSDLMPPADMMDKKMVHHPPCLCGNDRGNETKVFYKEAGFDRWVGYHDGGGLAHVCQRDMRKKQIPPVTAYLELCDNNHHFPLRYEHGHRVLPGADEHCDEVRKLQDALLEEGHDTHNINCRICFDTSVGATIKDSQKPLLTRHSIPDRYSFGGSCDMYDQTPGKQCLY